MAGRKRDVEQVYALLAGAHWHQVVTARRRTRPELLVKLRGEERALEAVRAGVSGVCLAASAKLVSVNAQIRLQLLLTSTTRRLPSPSPTIAHPGGTSPTAFCRTVSPDGGNRRMAECAEEEAVPNRCTRAFEGSLTSGRGPGILADECKNRTHTMYGSNHEWTSRTYSPTSYTAPPPGVCRCSRDFCEGHWSSAVCETARTPVGGLYAKK